MRRWTIRPVYKFMACEVNGLWGEPLTLDSEVELVAAGLALGVDGDAGVGAGRVPGHPLQDEGLVGAEDARRGVVVQRLALEARGSAIIKRACMPGATHTHTHTDIQCKRTQETPTNTAGKQTQC